MSNFSVSPPSSGMNKLDDVELSRNGDISLVRSLMTQTRSVIQQAEHLRKEFDQSHLNIVLKLQAKAETVNVRETSIDVYRLQEKFKSVAEEIEKIDKMVKYHNDQEACKRKWILSLMKMFLKRVKSYQRIIF